MVTRSQMLKYPFSKEARSISVSLARDVRDLLQFLERPENEYVIEEAEKRVLAALDRKDIPAIYTGDDRDFLIYNAARIIVESTNHEQLKKYQAEAESKAVNSHLGKEPEEFIQHLATTSLEWTVEPMGDITQRSKMPMVLRGFEFRMHVEDFVEVASRFQDPVWKLVNRYLDHGWVPVRKSELARLISGKFNRLILDSHIEIPPLPKRVAESVQRIESELGKKVWKKRKIKITKESIDALPPCIAQMREDSLNGKNLSHQARFAMTSFLLKIGMSIDQVLEIFRSAPDWNESLARYQVEHILGQRGAKDAYIPPSCKKMQVNGLCPVYLGEASDPLCEYISHPLAFYETRAWEISKNITNHSWYASKRKKKQHF